MTRRVHLTVRPSLSLLQYYENISLYKQNYLFVIISIRRKVVSKYLKITAGYVLSCFIIVYLRNNLFCYYTDLSKEIETKADDMHMRVRECV